MKYLIITAMLFSSWISTGAYAAAPTCHAASGGYCKYLGKVSKIYVNNSGIILLYFDNAIVTSDALVAGFTINHGNAAAFQMSDNIEFAKMFYATALAAQASGRDVSVQMHGVEAGYLKFSRIWLSESL